MSAASLCPGQVPAAVPSIPGQLPDLPTARTQNWTLYSHFSAKETEAGEIHVTSALNFLPRLLLFLRGHVSSSHTRPLPACTTCGPGVLGSQLSLLGPPHSRAAWPLGSGLWAEQGLTSKSSHVPPPGGLAPFSCPGVAGAGRTWQLEPTAPLCGRAVGGGRWGCAGARELGHQHVHALAGPALADLQDDGNFWES